MKRKVEATWAITRVHHERNRYIFNMHYKERKISKELLDYLIKEGYADPALIAKWRKVCSAHASTQTSTHTQIKKPTKQQGYERLCCMQCIQRSGSSGSTCICRVPKASLPGGKVVECVNCGCHGCASGD